MAVHNELGKKGEDIAAEFLLKKGHKIIARNYRYQKAEVDIISQIGETLVFSEVKARATDAHGYPELAINEKKKQLLRDAMDFYLTENNIKEESRFDFISVIINQTGTSIHHIEDAFYH